MSSLSKVVKKGKKWCVISPRNPDWSGGCYPTKKKATARLRQVEKAKHSRRASTGVSGIVKDYMKRVRSMRRLEDQANMAMARGDRQEAEDLLSMSIREGRWARTLHEEMTPDERMRVRSRMRAAHVLSGPFGWGRRP